MKKLIFAFIATMFAVLTATETKAQLVTMTGSGDSITNTGTKYLTANLDGNVIASSIQVTFTKTSGTAAGTATIEYSIDGTNYHTVVPDTFTVTNTTTQYYLWNLEKPNAYKYVRIKVVGSGTSRYRLNGLIYIRKEK